ncbi:MAG: hypothetical protein QF385_03300 [SAR324 cluster bacterium]|nr:hypothetical protein [SAR324 cluster bacterium]
MSLYPVILRGAEGEVAESILTERTLSLSFWDDSPQRALSNGTDENACGGSW